MNYSIFIVKVYVKSIKDVDGNFLKELSNLRDLKDPSSMKGLR